MKKEILSWGNSAGIRLLKKELEDYSIEVGDEIELTITKITKKRNNK